MVVTRVQSMHPSVLTTWRSKLGLLTGLIDVVSTLWGSVNVASMWCCQRHIGVGLVVVVGAALQLRWASTPRLVDSACG